MLSLSLSYSLMLQAKWDSIQQKFEFARAAHMEVTTKFFFLFVILFNGFAIYVFMGIHGEKQQQQQQNWREQLPINSCVHRQTTVHVQQ